MVYECHQCRAALPPGVRACPRCGKAFDEAVPSDAALVNSGDDFLRSRTASGTPRAETSFTSAASPRIATSASQPKVPAWVWLSLFIASFLVISLCLAGWAGYRAWQRGPGGEIAFAQHNSAGNRAYSTNDFHTAVDEYSQMIALRPRRVDGYLLRGMAYYSMGRFRDAIADDTVALSLPGVHTTGGDLYFNRATAERQLGQYPAAIRDLTSSLQVYQRLRCADCEPQMFGYIRDEYRQRASTYKDMHQFVQVEADCNTVIRRYAPDSSDFALRGEARAAQGKNAAALADFEQAIRLDPDNPNGYGEESDFLDKNHQYPQAIALWQRARRAMPEASPDNGRWWGSLGWFQYEAGQFPQALASDQAALDADRDQAWVRYNLGLLYAVQGSGAKAAATYTDSLMHSADPDRQAALKDIHHALAKQPHSATLLAAQQQLTQAQARKMPFPRWTRPETTRTASRAVPNLSLPRTLPGNAGAEIALGDYAITPPAGYLLKQDASNAADDSVAGATSLWSGPRRNDGTVPTLEIVIGQRQDYNISDTYNSDWVAQMALGVEHSRHTQFVPSPLEKMTLDGIPFTHVHWTGVGQKTGKTFAGDVYASVTEKATISLSTHDAVPYSASTLPLLQKSVLTFRQR